MSNFILKALIVMVIALSFGADLLGQIVVAAIAAAIVFNAEISKLTGAYKISAKPKGTQHPLED